MTQDNSITFERAWTLGYKRLLPLIPPGAPLSQHSGLDPSKLGKTPGRQISDGWVGFRDWPNYHARHDELRSWQDSGAGLGIIAGDQGDGSFFHVVDADVTDERDAEAVEALVREHFGVLPKRIGRAPKAAYVFRSAELVRYKLFAFSQAGGGEGKVEILSVGQQFVVRGIHPATMRPYIWPRPLDDWQSLKLQQGDTLQGFDAAMRLRFPDTKVSGKGSSRTKAVKKTAAGELARVTEAVRATPNVNEHFPDRRSWIKYGIILKASLPDNPDEGLELFQEWSFKWKGRYGESNDPDRVEQNWNSFNPSGDVGADYIYDTAVRLSGGLFTISSKHFDEPPKDAHEPVEHGAASAGGESDNGGKLPEVDTLSITSMSAIPGRKWSEPADLFDYGLDKRPLKLPNDCMPDGLGAWVYDTADRMGAPPAFVAASAVTVLSGAIGDRFRFQPLRESTDWTMPAGLWLALVERPGGLKSPVIKAAMRPLKKLDIDHSREDLVRHAEWEAQSKRKNGPPIGPEPRVRRYVAESFTIEALAKSLKDNPGGLMVSPDELTGLIGSLDAYKTNKGSDRPRLLQLYDGDAQTIDRATKPSVHVPMWGAAVLGGIQPKIMKEMASNLDSDGLLQRFNVVIGDGERGRAINRPPDAVAQATYSTLIREVASSATPLFPRPILLSEEAQVVWDDFSNEIRHLMHLPQVSDSWLGHINKWETMFGRILLTFHFADRWAEFGPIIGGTEVSLTTARRAERFGRFLLGQSIQFYEHTFNLGETEEHVQWFAGYLLTRSDLDIIRHRTLYDAKTELRGPEHERTRNAIFSQLECDGWLEPVHVGFAKSAGMSWRVNPLVHERYAERRVQETATRSERRQKIVEAGIARRRIVEGVA